MPNRKYSGNPIDATMSYISETVGKGGETVAGSTEDDTGDEKTTAIPAFVDGSDYSEDELQTLEQKALYPNESLKELSEHIPLSYAEASTFLAKFRRDHEDVLKHHQLYTKFAFKGSPDIESNSSQTTKSYSEDEQKVKAYLEENPDADSQELRENLELEDIGSSALGAYVSNARQHHADDSDEESDEASLAGVHRRLDDLESRLDDRPEPQPLSIEGVLDSDALYRLVNGESLTEEERRELFEVIVNDAG